MINNPEVNYEKTNEGTYIYDFYVSFNIYTSEKQPALLRDTTLHFKEILENWDVEFYASWVRKLLPGKYKMKISVEDIISGKTNVYDYTLMYPPRLNDTKTLS